MVNIFFEDIEILDLDPEFFVSWLSGVCKSHDSELGEINLIFCSDEYLLNMNQEHLDHDYYTDIITFNYNTESINGDLFISVDRVKDNAQLEQTDWLNELNRVVVHGVLHLIGFNDKTDDEQVEMTKQENIALEYVSRET